jgi:hypothetical protein
MDAKAFKKTLAAGTLGAALLAVLLPTAARLKCPPPHRQQCHHSLHLALRTGC